MLFRSGKKANLIEMASEILDERPRGAKEVKFESNLNDFDNFDESDDDLSRFERSGQKTLKAKKEDDEILNKRWRNHNYWDKYNEKQLTSLKEIVNKLCKDYNIPKNFIGHNVYDENVDLYKGITFRSNYSQESTDVSPAFDMELLKNL